MITVSIVSHGQNALVNPLLEDLVRHGPPDIGVILTQNIPDAVPPRMPDSRKLDLVINASPKGFGANHNAAFRRSVAPIFVVLNPDIRLKQDPFASLGARLRDQHAAAVGPLVRSPQGAVEDSARRFPTALSLLGKAFAGSAGPDYPVDAGPLQVDWLAGMCIAFRRDAFEKVGGFDERYFLYYEDVDLCRRLHAAGYSIVYDTTVSVVHDARRASRRDLRLMRIHAASALRFLLSR